ncbi:MAG: Zn-dependent hydrolase [Synergistales bacterium]|nr:Zn-dependent hydrolase [Synergistales bacterium]
MVALLTVNIGRIRRDIETICAFNATPGYGYTRFSYSREDALAREYLLEECSKLGLSVTVDGVGNIRARREGEDPGAPSVMAGSHIDTVLHGGKFDGLAGTVGALEAIRTIVEADIRLKHPVELVVFSEEEGSNFSLPLAGSKAMVGRHGPEDLKKAKSPGGRSMSEAAKNAGYNPDDLPFQVLRPEDVKAMLELHIEQSVVLDSQGLPVGIVEAIAALRLFETEISGVPNHAGATPMNLRKDPMVAAARVIAKIRDLARETPSGTTVGTVGRIFCEPNVSNVIPGKVRFTLDARDVDEPSLEGFVQAVRKTLQEESKSQGVVSEMRFLGGSKAVFLPPEITSLIENTANEREIPFMRMNSGAGHDSCLLATVTRVGMIFVPSIGGRSHVPEEDTRYEDLERGCNLLLGTLIKLAE